jgi:glycosyltransferase involved in cell wall biosynthesis
MTCLVSVLVPMYNAEPFIIHTLRSVLGQSHSDLEVIVVDDGSTDDGPLHVRGIKDPRLKLVRQDNAGQPAAFNTALSHAQGQYIQYIDADDLISPVKIELQLRRLQGNPCSVASAEWGRFCHDPESVRWNPEAVWQDLDPLDWLAGSRAEGGGMMFPALWLIPRGLVDQIGPWLVHYGSAQTPETEYFTRVVLAAKRILFCPGAKCYYRSGIPGSVSRRKSALAWRSQFDLMNSCERAVRQREDSDRIRRGFALSWQQFAYGCYPYDPQLAEQALNRSKELNPVLQRPDGGTAFHLTSRLLGWRLARRLQVWSGRP